jgi:hypothetical protein
MWKERGWSRLDTGRHKNEEWPELSGETVPVLFSVAATQSQRKDSQRHWAIQHGFMKKKKINGKFNLK